MRASYHVASSTYSRTWPGRAAGDRVLSTTLASARARCAQGELEGAKTKRAKARSRACLRRFLSQKSPSAIGFSRSRYARVLSLVSGAPVAGGIGSKPADVVTVMVTGAPPPQARTALPTVMAATTRRPASTFFMGRALFLTGYLYCERRTDARVERDFRDLARCSVGTSSFADTRERSWLAPELENA